MRKSLPKNEKRSKIIGVKTTEEIKQKLEYISNREDRPMSTQINILLEKFVIEYFEKNKLNWEECKKDA